MKRLVSLSLCLLLFTAGFARGQEPVDEQAVARIKTEGFQNSQVMEIASYLTDVHGPRLTGSPGLKAASEWSRNRLSESGLVNARLEPWGAFGSGWSVKKVSVEMMSPQYAPVIAYPKAWTPGTKGVLEASPTLVQINNKSDINKYKGKLRGALVMNGNPTRPNPHFQADARRLTQDLTALSQTATPGSPNSYKEEDEDWGKVKSQQNEITSFFHQEGIAALIEPSSRDHGVVRVGTQSYKLGNPHVSFPVLVMAREHYGRIARLLGKNIPVQLRIEVQTAIHAEDTIGYNVIAEIPGADPRLKDEVVMLGAHLDSWHAGTGATDNAAGCAIMMEAARILKATGLKPRRTIRVALWTGEEQGYYGSIGYVKKHFGDPDTLKLLPEHEKLSAYFNLDNGTGRIRGIYIQGNEAVKPIFEAYLRPFHYLGATTVTAENTGGTDHMPFEALGLPGFQFIQDPIEYDSRTHHTNMDVYEALLEDDLKQASVIIAAFVYHTFIRDERLPRKSGLKR